MGNISDMLSKILAILMSFIYMLMGGNADNTEIQITGPLTEDGTVLEYTVTNYTGKTMFIDKYFSIEKRNDNGWEQVPFVSEAATEDIAIRILNCESVTLKIDLTEFYGRTLEEGEYRLILQYTSEPVGFSVTK